MNNNEEREEFRKKLVSIIKKKERKEILDKLREIKERKDTNKGSKKKRKENKDIIINKKCEKPSNDPIKVDEEGNFKIDGIDFNSKSNHANGTCLWKILFFKLKNILDSNDDESVYKILSESATEIEINIGDPVYTTKLKSLICAINKRLDSKHKIKVKHYNCLHNLTESTLTFVEENLGEEGQIIYVASIANAASVYGNIHQIDTAGHFVTTLEFNNDKLINPDDWKSYKSFKVAINKKDNKNEIKVEDEKEENEKERRKYKCKNKTKHILIDCKSNKKMKNKIIRKRISLNCEPNKIIINNKKKDDDENCLKKLVNNLLGELNKVKNFDFNKELYLQPSAYNWCVLVCAINILIINGISEKEIIKRLKNVIRLHFLSMKRNYRNLEKIEGNGKEFNAFTTFKNAGISVSLNDEIGSFDSIKKKIKHENEPKLIALIEVSGDKGRKHECLVYSRNGNFFVFNPSRKNIGEVIKEKNENKNENGGIYYKYISVKGGDKKEILSWRRIISVNKEENYDH
jgi:hypothetical protein